MQLVLTLGTLNLLLGYLLAALLADPPLGGFAPWNTWKRWSLRLPRIRPGTLVVLPQDTEVLDSLPLPEEPAFQMEIAASEEPVQAEAPPPEPPLPAVATVDELPLAWRVLLAGEKLAPRWFADGLTQALRVQLAAYRQQVLAAEARARLVLSQESAEALEQLVADFRFLHHEWLAKLVEGAELLAARRGRLGAAEEATTRMESLLYDHAARLETLDRRISELNFKTDVVTGCRRLLAELLDLAASVHRLRDELAVMLTSILRDQQSLSDLPHEQRLDALTGRQNRLGLETVRQAPGAEQGGERQAVFIALDCFHRVNERLGTRAGDRTLRAFSQLLVDLLQRAGASAEIVRLAGTRFLLLIDGASREQATSLAELIRQSLEGVTFDCQGTLLEITARFGISTFEVGQTVDGLLARLTAAVDAAETAGRNRCVVADAGGTMVVAPHTVPVISRRVAIGEASELSGQSAAASSPRGTQPLPTAAAVAASQSEGEASTSS